MDTLQPLMYSVNTFGAFTHRRGEAKRGGAARWTQIASIARWTRVASTRKSTNVDFLALSSTRVTRVEESARESTFGQAKRGEASGEASGEARHSELN